MSKTVLTLLLAAALALPALAQGVKITRTDGRVVQGELLGYEQGRYRVRVAGGAVEEIDDSKVQDVVLTDRAAHLSSAARDTAATQAAREAFERGDFELSLQKLAAALKDLDEERAAIGELAARVAATYLESILEKRDAGRLAEAIRRTAPTLPPEGRRILVTRLAARLADLHKAEPDAAFTTAMAEALARLADDGTLPGDARGALADLFVQRGEAEASRKNLGGAFVLLQGAARIDPSRAGKLRPRILEVALARSRARAEANDGIAALAAAKDALAVDPASAEAAAARDEAEFLVLKSEVDAEFGGPESLTALRAYLAKSPSADKKAWAESTLAKIQSSDSVRSPAVSVQLRKYFPVKPGRVLVYRRADGEIVERIRQDAAVREGEVLRVFHTLKEVYRDFATSKSYVVEVERDRVVLPAGGDREPLLKFPAKAGDTWTWQSKAKEFRRTVRSVGEAVTTGTGAEARTWTDCLVVDFTSTVDRDGRPVTLTSRSSYAPGAGLVKLEFLDAEFRKYSLELAEILAE
jgi:hypothetical protein